MGCSSFAMGYLDDIIIFSKTEEEHLQHLQEIFVRLCKFGLKMKCEKCSFFKKHIQYLGHLVSEKGFELLPEKLESIHKIPAPRTAKEVKQFLGLIGYYRKFAPRFTDISRPLTKLTRHNVIFEWTDQCAKAFNHLRELLMEYPILRYPNPKKVTSCTQTQVELDGQECLHKHIWMKKARQRTTPSVTYVDSLEEASSTGQP